MTRKYTRKKEIEGFRPETPTEKPQGAAPSPPPVPEKAENQVIEDLNGLPNRDLLRVFEVATYLSKAESTIRLWIDHGYFITEKFRGSLWVTRQSVIDFRLKNRANP